MKTTTKESVIMIKKELDNLCLSDIDNIRCYCQKLLKVAIAGHFVPEIPSDIDKLNIDY